ncbi:MAG: hypothetical protein LBF58_05160 [Deltaproteobacteria bacterium]|nr:hypothetical protein [Deltaproteobacteria bacterium]
MLRPNRHSHPDKTVIHLSTLLLERIKFKKIEGYVELLEYAKKNVDGGYFLFQPALNLLFLLGLIEYHPKIDSFEYIGRNETF